LIGSLGFVVAVTGLFALAWFCLWQRGYLWQRQSGMVVTVNGQPSTGTAVYRAHDGTLLVLGDPATGEGIYMISPSSGCVSRPNSYEFRIQTGLFVLAQDPVNDIAVIDITNEIKGEGAAAHLIFRRGEYVEFTTVDWLTPTNPQLVSHRRRVPL
jgi:hypothetical protein